jgi:hypothetical protein
LRAWSSKQLVCLEIYEAICRSTRLRIVEARDFLDDLKIN